MHLIRDVLDKQLIDRTNTKIGKVDGLVALIGPGQPRVVAIEVGASTLARRSGFTRTALRVFGAHDREAFRIPWSKVKDVGVDIEVDLAANNLAKSPRTVARLVKLIRKDPAERPFALWRLGALGNRGVQPNIVLNKLMTFAHDRDEQTRFWAVEGLSMLGTDAVVDPLLDRFAHDSSARVRQRAAVAIAESGMLTHEQRFAAIPDLLNLLDDDSLNDDTRAWVYGALRLITGEPLGNNPTAWQQWWAHHDKVKKSRSPKNLVFA